MKSAIALLLLFIAQTAAHVPSAALSAARHAPLSLRAAVALPLPRTTFPARCAPVHLAARTRPRVPPPPPGAPTPWATFRRWTLVQLSADGASVASLCVLTGETPLDLYREQNVLLWVLLGPALVTFGAVWARITQGGAAERYGEDDFFVQKLGGADAVASLRYSISESMRF